MLGGFLLANHLFALDKQQALLASRPFFATEAFVIRELRREAETEIRRRDEAIARYLERIQRLEDQEATLLANLQEERRRYASEVRQELEGEIGFGATEAEVNEALRERLEEFDREQEGALRSSLAQIEDDRMEAVRLLEEENRLRRQAAQELDDIEDAEAAAFDWNAGEAPSATAGAVTLPEAGIGTSRSDLPIVEALSATVRRLEEELRRYQQGAPPGTPGTPAPTSATGSGLPDAEAQAARRELSRDVLELLKAVEAGERAFGTGGLATDDPALRRIGEAIEEIVEPYRVVETRSYRRIAAVSLVSGREVSAEIIGAGRPEIGAPVEIRRRLSDSAELRVARGRITGISGERITIDVATVLTPEEPPRVLDTVYLEE